VFLRSEAVALSRLVRAVSSEIHRIESGDTRGSYVV